MTYYQLNSEKLQSGDVILEVGSGLISGAIKFADRGAFSHVFLYVGMNAIMEADEGVRMILASRVITDAPNKFLVLRHPDLSASLEKHEWQDFTKNLMFMVLHPETNKPYNWWGTFATKLPFLTGKKHSFFCSQLVAEGYKCVGVRLFQNDIPPERVTPNMFVSENCLLKPVTECFSALPDRHWMSQFARNRYDVINDEPIPLAQGSHETSKEIVAIFGPRVDELTKRINKVQHITSPQELYLTLTFPDLPEAEEVSDDLVEFMKLRYPSDQISNFIKMTKLSMEEAVSKNEPDLTALLVRTLRKDISAIEQMIPMFEAQARMMETFPPPPMKRRSIHDWIAEKTIEAVAIESEFLNWRKTLLNRIVK